MWIRRWCSEWGTGFGPMHSVWGTGSGPLQLQWRASWVCGAPSLGPVAELMQQCSHE